MARKYKNLCLFGFRCSGKSFTAGLISKRLNWPIYALDKCILKSENKSMSAITKNGTDLTEFRAVELKILKELLDKENIIIDCGSGVGVNDVNGQEEKELLLNSKSTLKVLIGASKKVLATRLTNNYTKSKKREKKVNPNTVPLREFLNKSFELLDTRYTKYQEISDIEMKFNKYINIDKIIKKLKTEIITIKRPIEKK